jgi:hypothetical protein
MQKSLREAFVIRFPFYSAAIHPPPATVLRIRIRDPGFGMEKSRSATLPPRKLSLTCFKVEQRNLTSQCFNVEQKKPYFTMFNVEQKTLLHNVLMLNRKNLTSQCLMLSRKPYFTMF